MKRMSKKSKRSALLLGGIGLAAVVGIGVYLYATSTKSTASSTSSSTSGSYGTNPINTSAPYQPVGPGPITTLGSGGSNFSGPIPIVGGYSTPVAPGSPGTVGSTYQPPVGNPGYYGGINPPTSPCTTCNKVPGPITYRPPTGTFTKPVGSYTGPMTGA